MGVELDRLDRALVLATTPYIIGRFALMARASHTPPLQGWADATTLHVLRKRLATYGVTEAMTEAHGHIAH